LLIGRSHECDFPAYVKRLPSLTEPKFPVTGTSYEIDAGVKAILEGLSVYGVDATRLEALRPDVIATQDHCEVCAVSLKNVEAALQAWSGRRDGLRSYRSSPPPSVTSGRASLKAPTHWDANAKARVWYHR